MAGDSSGYGSGKLISGFSGGTQCQCCRSGTTPAVLTAVVANVQNCPQCPSNLAQWWEDNNIWGLSQSSTAPLPPAACEWWDCLDGGPFAACPEQWRAGIPNSYIIDLTMICQSETTPGSGNGYVIISVIIIASAFACSGFVPSGLTQALASKTIAGSGKIDCAPTLEPSRSAVPTPCPVLRDHNDLWQLNHTFHKVGLKQHRCITCGMMLVAASDAQAAAVIAPPARLRRQDGRGARKSTAVALPAIVCTPLSFAGSAKDLPKNVGVRIGLR